MEDEKIIELFFARSETAISELDTKYGKLCHQVSHNILRNESDAEECVNDSYLGMWNSLPPARPNPLRAYLLRIVKNISLKKYAYNTAAKRNSIYDVAMDELEDCLTAPGSVEDTAETRELTAMLERFLDSLSPENRVLFLRRYWFADSYEEIGKFLGITPKNVSVRLTRLRSRLKTYLAEREVFV